MNTLSSSTAACGLSYEMHTLRCQSVVDGMTAFGDGCQQQNPTRLQPSPCGNGRSSWNYIYSNDKVHAGLNRSCVTSLGSEDGRVENLPVSPTYLSASSQHMPVSPSTSSSAYRISSSCSNGSQSSSLQSSGTESQYGGCGCCFPNRNITNEDKKHTTGVKVTATIGTYRKAGNRSGTGNGGVASKASAVYYGGGSGTRSFLRGLSSPGQTFNSLVLTYLERTSAHALPRVARSRGRVRRIMWIGTFAFFVGYFVYQFAALLDMFYSYPVGATISIEQRRVMDFPAVTVCNLNVMKSSRLVKDSRYHHISGIDQRFKKGAENLLKNDDKGLGDRLDLRGDATRTDGNHTGDGTSAAPRHDDSVRNKITSQDQGKRRLDASTFRGVERQIAVMMKKIRRSRKDVGRDHKPPRTGDHEIGDTRSTMVETSNTQRQLLKGNTDEDGNIFMENEGSNLLMASEENETISGKMRFPAPNGRNVDRNVDGAPIHTARDTIKRADRETKAEKDFGRQGGKKVIKDAYSAKEQTDDGLIASDQSQATGFDYEDSSFTSVSNDYEFDELMAKSTSSDYSDLYQLLKPTSEDLERYGHQPNDFLVQCSFDTKNCSHRDFHRRVSPFFGNCYTFNHRMNGMSTRTSSKYGSRYGLRLTLNIEHDEYLGLFSHKAGVRVAVHPFNVTPFPEDVGLDAMPGCETEIGVTVEAIKRVPHPHPSNCTDRKKNVHHPGDNDIYTVLSCSKHCLQRKLEEFCGCVDGEVTSVNDSIVRCVSTNSTQEKCRQLVRHFYENNQQQCDCPPACEELIYKTTVSSATWPSQPYANLLASVLFEDKTFTDMTEVYNSNLVSVHVYLTDMNIRRIEEYPSYPWDRLLADIGGMLGLFIGISACTAVEFIEFLVDAVLLAVMKCRFGAERQPTVRFAASAISS